jgi:L-amino acid N-acyltransferase YncA
MRPATTHDAAAVLAIYAPSITDSVVSFEEAVPSVAEIADRIESTMRMFPFLVLEEDDRVLGYAYASAHRTRASYRWSVDVSAYVDQSARRRGIGRALYTELIAILTQQRFHMAFAGITLPNAASVALHEAVGFVYFATYKEVGYKFGRWHDVGWWQRAIGAAGTPNEPALFLGNLDRFVAAGILAP